LIPNLIQRERVPLKLHARRRQSGAAAPPLKERAAELGLEALYADTDGGLCEAQPFRGASKTPCGDDVQEGPNERGVHDILSKEDLDLSLSPGSVYRGIEERILIRMASFDMRRLRTLPLGQATAVEKGKEMRREAGD
jgi:hypothetical protein